MCKLQSIFTKGTKTETSETRQEEWGMEDARGGCP
jgi:hypothetical protein